MSSEEMKTCTCMKCKKVWVGKRYRAFCSTVCRHTFNAGNPSTALIGATTHDHREKIEG